MSACPKIEPEYDDLPVETPAAAQPTASPSPWWHGAIHMLALLGLLGLCAFLAVVGLLWFSLAMEPG